MKKRACVRRGPQRRRRVRRHIDFYRELGKFAGLIAFVSAAIIGQAELIGEPWRHVLTVTAIMCTAIWAYCMKPNNVSEIAAAFKRR